MFSDKQFLKKYICQNDIYPELGCRQINTQKFIKWYQENRQNKINGTPLKDFDILSVTTILEEDLIQFFQLQK